MLKVGDKLPQFEGTNQDGETISSSNLIGKKASCFLLSTGQYSNLYR